MSKRYFSFRNIKPIDIVFIVVINVVCGVYVWKPFLKDVYEKRIEHNPYNKVETTQHDNSLVKQIQDGKTGK